MKLSGGKMRQVKNEILWLRLFSIGCAIAAAATVAVCWGKVKKTNTYWENKSNDDSIFLEDLAIVLDDLRDYEYKLNRLNGEIQSKILTIQQNIDTAYIIFEAKSSRTTDDELMRVIKERVTTPKESMNTGDLFQAIEVMKEHFPAATFAELDNLYEKNIQLLAEVNADKKEFNVLLEQYESLMVQNADILNRINFMNYEFEQYEIEEAVVSNGNGAESDGGE